MKLLVVCPYFEPHVGGLEGYVSELNQWLQDAATVEHITVFTADLPASGLLYERRGPRYQIVRYPAVEVIANFPVPAWWKPSFWRALRVAWGGGNDVLISHTRFFVTSALALAWARCVRRPLLHVEHGSDFVQLNGRMTSAIARVYDLLPGRLILRRADEVVTVSMAAADFVRTLAGRESQVIYRGRSRQRVDSARPDRELVQQAAGRPIVAFLGRLIDGKGVSDLLSAAATLEPKCLLCIVGDGPRRADLEQQALGLGIESSVIFMGYLPEEEALDAMCAAEVVVNPSYTEGLPTSVLEAALMGKAVLATDVGGTSEIIEDGRSGLLVSPHSPAAIRRGLAMLLGDSALRKQLGSSARRGALERFSWATSAEQFLLVIERLTKAQPDQHGPRTVR